MKPARTAVRRCGRLPALAGMREQETRAGWARWLQGRHGQMGQQDRWRFGRAGGGTRFRLKPLLPWTGKPLRRGTVKAPLPG